MNAPSYKQLVQALDDMVEAYNYSGGGDSWEQEVWGDRTRKAERILQAAKDPKNAEAKPAHPKGRWS